MRMKKKVKMMAIACIAALSCQAQNTIFPTRDLYDTGCILMPSDTELQTERLAMRRMPGRWRGVLNMKKRMPRRWSGNVLNMKEGKVHIRTMLTWL